MPFTYKPGGQKIENCKKIKQGTNFGSNEHIQWFKNQLLEAKNNNWQLPTTYSGYSLHAYDTLILQNEKLSSSEILAFRDKAWMEYHKNKDYLSLIENKFSFNARINIEQTTKIKLTRKLLGD